MQTSEQFCLTPEAETAWNEYEPANHVDLNVYSHSEKNKCSVRVRADGVILTKCEFSDGRVIYAASEAKAFIKPKKDALNFERPVIDKTWNTATLEVRYAAE